MAEANDVSDENTGTCVVGSCARGSVAAVVERQGVNAESIPVSAANAAANAAANDAVSEGNDREIGAFDQPQNPALQQQNRAAAYAAQDALELKNLTNQDFSQREYWEQRFKEEPEYDWLCDYEAVAPHLMQILKDNTAARILVIGCGNSTFSGSLYDAGFTNIVNIDFAASVISRMKTENAQARPNMQWLEMDMLDMSAFADGFFDMVIGKGSLDALQAAIKDVWSPTQECRAQAHTFLSETRRVLCDRGYFFSVSFEQPHFRTKFLMGKADAFETDPYATFVGYSRVYGWELSYKDIGAAGCLSVFVYVMHVCEEPPVEAQGGGTDSQQTHKMSGHANACETGTASAQHDVPADIGSRVRLDIPGNDADHIHNGFPSNSDSSW